MKKTLLSLLVAVGLVGSASAQLTGDLTNGLVGYWSLNGTTKDSSSYDNTGTGYDLVLTTDRFGKANNSYYFNGTTSYIDLGNQSQYNFGNSDFTLSAWVLSGSKQVDYADYIIGKLKVPDTLSYGLGTHNSTVNIYSFFRDEQGAFVVTSSSATIQDSNWHFLTATFNRSGSLSIYLDGVLDGSQDISWLSGSQSNTSPLVIGGIDSASLFGSQLFEGKISDVGIWNRALSSTEVFQLYVIPEPSTYALFGIGAIGLLMVLRRKKVA